MPVAKAAIAVVFLLAACEAAPVDPQVLHYSTPGNTSIMQQVPRPRAAGEVAFVKAGLNALQQRSIAENREYCGYLGKTLTGTLALSPARRGDVSGCTPDEPPAGLRLLASYHTHAAYAFAYDSEVPSSDDLEGDMAEGVNGYVATPGGRLWFIDAAIGRAILLCGPGCVAADPRFEPDPAFPVRNSYSLAELRVRQN